MRTYVRSRAWSDAELDAAEERLASRGLVADGAFTDAGRAAREEVEVATDAACEPILRNVGDDLDELVGLLAGRSKQVQAANGHPGSRPPQLPAASRRSAAPPRHRGTGAAFPP